MGRIKYIIVQAGGRGSRMEYLVDNKPKALISVNGEPMIIRQMKLDPKAHYFIIADYKKEILKDYLNLYAPAKYTIIKPKQKKTSSGIGLSLQHIPDNNPFLIIWSDLYFSESIYPKNLDFKRNNYLGLSRDFRCRWSFTKNTLQEKESKTHGIAGVFVFKNKAILKKLPESYEFCKFLQEENVGFKHYFLQETKEVGTLEAYTAVTRNFLNTRPFNKIEIKKNKIVKIPLDAQGKKLAKQEISWYKVAKKNHISSIPNVYSFHPLTLERINGVPLYQEKISIAEKKRVLKKIVEGLSAMHSSLPAKKRNFYSNDYEAIIGKTKKRLDGVVSLIPNIHSSKIVINNKSCINFYKKWNLVEKMFRKHFGNEYVFIHGDPTFSNTLVNKEKEVFFIDPRGYYGKSLLFGDKDYDFAKVYYSLVGNYDYFNIKNFRLQFDKQTISVIIPSNGWESLEDYFFSIIPSDKEKIKAYHAIIWLSLASYAWDNYDSVCTAFYKGIYFMQEIYEKTL